MRSALVLALPLILLVTAEPSAAQEQRPVAPDAWVTLTPETQAENDPQNIVALNASSDWRWVLDLTLDKPYTTLEIQARGLGLERARQLVPYLEVGADRYPLFHPYPNERVWEADAPAQVFHVSGEPDDLVLRLGVPGPGNETLVLEVDTTAPGFEVGEIQHVTSIGFYVETQTTELALGDLLVRAVGETEWVRNPTPEYHVLQKFPVQGLDAGVDHEFQVVFEDWAGNAATSPFFHVRTAPLPVASPVSVRPIEPAPNSTVQKDVRVRASVESAVSVPRESIRLFFDLREVTDFVVEGGNVSYVPPGPLEAGTHVVSVEARNAEGGSGFARWTFDVGGRDSPLPSAWIILALLAAAGTMRASRRA